MITTQSGKYEIEQYKKIENKLKKAFVDYWHNEITSKELLQIQKESGLSYAEIKGIQAITSFEDSQK